jgi:glycosyltransferase involved in cell wall biosynthesis
LRVAVVGPSPPDRGGISQQTRLLAEHLGPDLAGYFSFARPYPRWLDPRRFGTLPSRPVPPGPAPRRTFDYARPGSWRRTAREIIASGAEAVVVPWWTSFWALPVRGLFRALEREAPRVVRALLCHNVEEHESSRLRRFLSWGAFETAHALLVHSEEERQRVERMFPGRPVLVRPLPVEDRPRPDPARTREKLGVGRPLVLFLGLVRRYKGVDVLLAAAPRILSETGAWLAIVGESFGGARSTASGGSMAGLGPRVLRVDRYVSETEMDEWLAACDLVVCPYRRISGSAIAARAVGARRPIVASDLSGFRPFVSERTGRLVAPGDPEALAEAVREVLQKGPERYHSGLSELAERLGWKPYVASLLELCASARLPAGR